MMLEHFNRWKILLSLHPLLFNEKVFFFCTYRRHGDIWCIRLQNKDKGSVVKAVSMESWSSTTVLISSSSFPVPKSMRFSTRCLLKVLSRVSKFQPIPNCKWSRQRRRHGGIWVPFHQTRLSRSCEGRKALPVRLRLLWWAAVESRACDVWQSLRHSSHGSACFIIQ